MNAIAIVIVSVVGLIFVILLINAILTIYDLERAKQNLKDEKSNLSDMLRLKKNQIDRLLITVAKLEGK